LLLLSLKLLLRRERLASWLLVAVLTVVQALSFAGGDTSPWLGATLSFVVMASFTLLLRHVGVLACFTGVVMANLLLNMPLTLDLDHWTAGASLLVLASVAALAAYALRTSIEARPAR
jgi:hypothetical protein